MANWLEMISDNAIPNEAVMVAPNGEKITMGQVREGWLAQRGDYERKSREIKEAQKELANVYTILNEEKLAFEKRESELRTREAQLSTLQDAGQGGSKAASALEQRIAQLEQGLNKANATNMEFADIWLDEKWNSVHAKFKEDLPDGVSRNDVLKFALQQGIKDRAGRVDLEAAASRIAEPKRRERDLKEAEERGAKRAREEMLLGSLGSPNSFQTREAPDAKVSRFSNLDDAFAAAAKDATMFFGNGNIQ